MTTTGDNSQRTAFERFDHLSGLMLRMALQALPVFLTIAAANYIGRHL